MQEDIGQLIVRLSTGGLLLLHGVHKLLNGIGPIKAMLASNNAPEIIGYGVYLGEIVGPILVILGVFSRVGGLLIAINMTVAILLARTGAALMLNAQDGGYALELDMFFLLGGITVMLLRAGRLGLGIGGRWN